MNKNRYGPIITSIVICLIGLGFIVALHNHWTKQEITVNSPMISKVKESSKTIDLKTIIHETEKSVIQIDAQGKSGSLNGSGFLYNDKGDIITNAHVVKDANVVYIRTANAQIYPAAIIGIGEDIDIALLRVPQLANSPHLSMELEQDVEIGDEVIALGSPHGFQNTVTLGIISGTGRKFNVDGYEYNNSYQISALITHGNSGGPLISRYTGNVIGINAVGTEDGIGFSMPLKDVIDQFEQWSNETTNEEIDLPSTSDITHTFDEEQMVEDAKYLIDYFFDSIKVRDYVTAYTLLSSTMQAEVSYTDFRGDFTEIIDLSREKKSIEILEGNNISAIYSVTLNNKLPNKDTNKETVEYQFEIGLENDQLKINKLKNTK